jgi:capsular polysaccharide transport system permease protein
VASLAPAGGAWTKRVGRRIIPPVIARGVGGVRNFLRSFAIQRRVIGALIMRETYSRFGRENLGFAWVFGEFLVFALPVIVMWHFIRGKYEHNFLVVPFVWSGYLPILLFRHIGGHMLSAVRLNMSLLYHRNVTPFDAVISRMAIEVMGNYGAGVFSFFLLYAIGQIDWPRDPPLLFVGYFYMTWWCVAVGLVVAAFSERTVVFEKVWQPISYMYLPVSGFFYMAAWIPKQVRDVLLAVMPALPSYEMIRAGLFGPVMQYYYDIPRLSFTLAAITLFGLLGLRDVRRYLVNE